MCWCVCWWLWLCVCVTVSPAANHKHKQYFNQLSHTSCGWVRLLHTHTHTHTDHIQNYLLVVYEILKSICTCALVFRALWLPSKLEPLEFACRSPHRHCTFCHFTIHNLCKRNGEFRMHVNKFQRTWNHCTSNSFIHNSNTCAHVQCIGSQERIRTSS